MAGTDKRTCTKEQIDKENCDENMTPLQTVKVRVLNHLMLRNGKSLKQNSMAISSLNISWISLPLHLQY